MGTPHTPSRETLARPVGERESEKETKDSILIGRQDKLLEVPAEAFRAHLEHARASLRSGPSQRVAFMTPEHHSVRNFAVRELPRNDGKPLKAGDIARRLRLPLAAVKALLDDLQKHLFFLVLNPEGEVSWAYPVTVEETPHRLRV